MLGQPGQPAKQPDQDAGRCGDRDPPPLPAEPAGTGIDIPVVAEADDPHEHQAGECAEDTEGDRIAQQHPELPRLGQRH